MVPQMTFSTFDPTDQVLISDDLVLFDHSTTLIFSNGVMADYKTLLTP